MLTRRIRDAVRPRPAAVLRAAAVVLGLLLAPLAGGAETTPSTTAPVPVTALTAYLEGLSVGRAAFVQHNADGSQSTGVLSFRRPWHGRIEYAAPQGALIIAAGRQVAVFDRRANTGPAIYPVRRTPLAVLVGPGLDLADPAHYRAAGTTPSGSWIEIGLTPSAAETLTLVFHHAPLRLAGWLYRDAQGQETTVVLDPIRTDVRFPPGHFSIEQHTERLFPSD